MEDPENLRQRIWERFQKKRAADSYSSGLRIKRRKSNDLNEIKIKTLEEIRAERANKIQATAEICDNSVSSSQDVVPSLKPQRIKLQRRPLFLERKEEEEVLDKDINCDELSESKDEEMLTVSDTSKALDEVLLLQDDDDNSNVSFKDEDRLLNEFDDFLDN